MACSKCPKDHLCRIIVEKMFVRVRDTAENVMFYVMGKSGSFLHPNKFQET